MNKRRLASRLAEYGFDYQLDEPLARHTTFQIGGNADVFLEVTNEARLAVLAKICREARAPLFLIGRGSNLLVSDAGIEGVVVRLGGTLCQMERLPGDRIFCGAGASLTALCNFALAQSLSGLEFAFGIPGTVGGAVFMNAGAYGGEMADVLLSSRHLTAEGEAGAYQKEELQLGYRQSRYQRTGEWITGVTVQLRPGAPDEIEARMRELMERRRSKQPLEYPSAGSVFRRPEGHYAGTLIESCGLKGARVGGAEVSEKHAGFIVNRGGATCRDVLALIEKIQQTVKEKTDVALEPEIAAVGRGTGAEATGREAL